MDSVFLILTLGFQDQFLENIIVSRHHTVRQARQNSGQRVDYYSPDFDFSVRSVILETLGPRNLPTFSDKWGASTWNSLPAASVLGNKSCVSCLITDGLNIGPETQRRIGRLPRLGTMATWNRWFQSHLPVRGATLRTLALLAATEHDLVGFPFFVF